MDELDAVDALTPTNVWAVGAYAKRRTQKALVEHWDGTGWQWISVPGLGSSTKASNLTSVTATSPADIWAAGSLGMHTLLEHWDGTRWTQVKSPNPGRSENVLNGVSADSETNARTVGDSFDGNRAAGLTALWNGSTWRIAR